MKTATVMNDASIRLNRRRRRNAGFTYIGLLVLIAMMGFALTVVSDVWLTTQKREKEAELLYVGDQIRVALGFYFASSPGGLRLPRTLEDLTRDPRYPGVRRYLRKVYRDPITGRAEWGLLKGPGDVIIGVYSLSEDEPFKQTGFSLADRAFEGKKKYSEWVFIPKSNLGFAPIPQTGVTPGTPQGGVAPGSQGGISTGTPRPFANPGR